MLATQRNPCPGVHLSQLQSTGGTTARRAVLRGAVQGQLRLVTAAAALLMSWQACESLVPVVIGATVDKAIAPHDGRAVIGWIAVLAVLFGVLSFSFRFGSRLSRQASEQAAHETRIRLAGVVLDPRTRTDPLRRTATVASIASSDADRLGSFCAAIPRTCGALISVVVASVALLRISIPLGLLVLVGAPPLLLAVHALGAPLERRSGAEQARAAEAATITTDLVTGLRVLKGIGGEATASDRYRAASRRSLQATLHAARAEATYDGATMLLTSCFLAVVALIGGRFAAEERISVGDLVAAVGLAQFLLGPLSQLSSTGAMLARARASAQRIAGVVGSPRRDAGPVVPPVPLQGALTVLTPRVTFTAAPGELLGIVATPETATAIVDLLASSDDAGVSIDGVPVIELAPDIAAGALLVARHDAHLFAQTVLANVEGTGADDARVRAAIAASDTDQVAQTLPAGLGTVITERGRSLSGGQRQRVALARALAADAAVLVLHDPTTAVDTATETRIAGGLRAIRAGRTTILLTTSPALLSACDRVLLIGDGRVEAEGSHAQLATRHAYRELVFG